MSIREKIIDYSRGNDLSRFWRLYRRQQRAMSGFRRDVLTFLMSRCAASSSMLFPAAAKRRTIQSVSIP
jgi:hypothetical protein